MGLNKIKMDINTRGLIILISVLIISGSSCKKLVETPPPSNSITESNVFTVDATAIASLNGIYISMNENFQPFQGNNSISLLAALSADELTLYNGITSGYYYGYYRNQLSATLGTPFAGSEHWTPLYRFVFRCNAAIDGLNKSSSLTPLVKQQLLGEAKFMRAFFYFYLVNTFGDVPLALTTNADANTLLSRSPKADVYKQIIADLKEAEELLGDNFLAPTLLSSTGERVRPTKWAASAMLARAYLYTNDYTNAELKSSAVINYTSLFGPISSVPLNSVFLKNSKEAIWQLQPTVQFFNTQEAKTFVIPPQGPNSSNNPVFISKQCLNNFEANDQRKLFGNWIDTTIYTVTTSPLVRDTVAYCYKYKKNEQDQTIVSTPSTPGYTKMTEYFMVLRLGEQYLIRAEARAQLGNISGAQSDLNTIRIRAGLPNTTANDQASLITAILKERQVELFCEWGHRWFDLKRMGKVDEVMNIATLQKSSGATSWQSFQQLYPIGLEELQKAPNLVQTPGY
jgi:hypothetical protein